MHLVYHQNDAILALLSAHWRAVKGVAHFEINLNMIFVLTLGLRYHFVKRTPGGVATKKKQFFLSSKYIIGTRDPPPFMENVILGFHLDFWNPSLNDKVFFVDENVE